MKIVYIIDQPNLYGSEKHVLSLIRHLSKTNEVSLVAFNNGILLDILKNENLSFSVIKIGWFPNTNLRHLSRLIKSSENTIFHGHQPKAIFWGSILSRFYKKKFISTIHSLPETNARSYSNIFVRLIVFLFHFMVKMLAELLSSKIIYLSKFTYGKSFFKEKSFVIPNWIERMPNCSLLRNTFDLDCIKLVSVGSITYNKGYDRVIAALGLLKFKNWQLTIVGDGTIEFIQDLKKMCIHYNIEKNVIILPYDSEIFDKLGQYDAFILFSRGETFGMVYIEAMSWGLPIFAWNIPVIEEIIPPCNFVIDDINDFGEEFKKFSNSFANQNKISTINREFVLNNFDRSVVLNKYQNLYNEILSIDSY